MSLTTRLDRLEKAAPAGLDEEDEPAVVEGLRRHAYEARTDPAETWETYAAMSPRQVVRAAAAVWPFPLAGLVAIIREEIAVDALLADWLDLLPERHRAGLAEWMALLRAGDDSVNEHAYHRAGIDLVIEAIATVRGKQPEPPADVVLRWVEHGPWDKGARRIWPPGGVQR